MALDETALAALRALRTQSTPKREDRARIKAKLLISVAPFSGLATSAMSTATATGNTDLGGVGPSADLGAMGSGPAGMGVTSGGLVGVIGAKVGVATLCVLMGAIGWAGIARWGSSSRTPVANSAVPSTAASPVADDDRAVPTVATRDSSPREPRAAAEIPVQTRPSVTPGQGRRSVSARSTFARTTAEDATAREGLQSEIVALRAAQEALRDGDPDAALRHLEKREQDSQLARDREGLRAVALCDAKQAEAGRKAAERFLNRYGSSALARRVRSACAKFLVSPGTTEGSH